MKSGRINLRAPEPEDVDQLYAWENDPSLWHLSNTLAPYSRYMIEQFVLSVEDLHTRKQTRFIIEAAADGQKPELIGTLDLFDYDPMHARAGIGILIDAKFRKQGYAHEALQLIIRYAFGVLNLHQLHCEIESSNTLSQALFEKNAFTCCGTKRQWVKQDDTWQDVLMYQLLNS